MDKLARGSFCLKGHIDVPPEKREDVANSLDQHIRLTREEAGCIFFNVEKCDDVEGRYLVSEAFTNEAAFKEHQARASSSDWAVASRGVPRSYETWIVE